MEQNEIKDISTKTLVMILLVILAVTGLIFGGFKLWEYSKRAALDKEYSRQFAIASEKLLGYIYEKYGFEAEILEDQKADDHNKGILRMSLDDDSENVSIYLYMKLRWDSREFYAHVYESPDGFKFCDNYQYDEIRAALTDKISKSLPGGFVMRNDLGDREAYAPNFSFFDIYYDGSNLDEVISRCSGWLEMMFPDVGFSQCDIVDRLCQTRINIKFTAFDTADKMEEFFETARPVITTADGRQFTVTSSDNTPFYKQYEPYITDCIETKGGEIKTKSRK